MQNPVTEWRLHIGCHKTATTHLQNTLELLQGELRARDLDYITRTAFRAARVPKRLGKIDWLPASIQWPLRRRWDHLVAPLRGEARRVMISEENFLGGAGGLLRWPFYPESERRFRWIRALSAGAKLHVFLSIRSFDELLPSAYAEILRYLPVPGGFAPVRQWALASPPSWLDLIARIRSALPGATLSVWTFEDYLKSPGAVISAFSGTPLAIESLPPVPQETKSPSAEAIARIERLDPNADERQHMESVARILADCKTREKFRPFSADESQRLRRAYAEDLGEIRARYPGMLIEVA